MKGGAELARRGGTVAVGETHNLPPNHSAPPFDRGVLPYSAAVAGRRGRLLAAVQHFVDGVNA